MAGEIADGDALAVLTRALVRQLPDWCIRAKFSSQYISAKSFSGALASRRVVARGIERADPRPYTAADDPSAIDTGRLPVTAAYSLPIAIAAGELRLVQAVNTVESEFVAVVDLSRSILAGFFEPWVTPAPAYDVIKVPPLFYAVAAYVYLAAGLGFRLRVICSQGFHTHEERSSNVASLLDATVRRMRAAMLDAQRTANANQALVEPFNLAFALRAVLGVRVRSVVLVVSDFLDPVTDYARFLTEAACRHYVILADLASTVDRDFPVPKWFDRESQRVELREGARHLELNTLPHSIPRQRVRVWNADRLNDYKALRQIARATNAVYHGVGAARWSTQPRFNDFLRCYMTALRQLQALR